MFNWLYEMSKKINDYLDGIEFVVFLKDLFKELTKVDSSDDL